jgi:hypothetical protein
MLQNHGCSQDDDSLEWTVNVNVGSKPEVNRNDDSKANAKANN